MTNINEYTNNIFSSGVEKLHSFPKKLYDFCSHTSFIPVALEIQPCGVCNHHCAECLGLVRNKSICSVDSCKSKHMDLSVLDSVWEHPPNGIIISGNYGDPLLYNQIRVLLQKIAFQKIPYVLITNGSYLNKEVNDLVLNDSAGIRVSLDAIDHITYKQSHGVDKSEWDKVISNIQCLVDQKRIKQVEYRNCSIGIGFLTNESNYNQILAAIVLANDLGVDFIHFRPYHYSTFNPTGLIPRIKKMKLRRDFSVFFSNQKYQFFDYEIQPKIRYCMGSFFYTTLDYNGDIYICCHQVDNSEAKIGSLKKSTWKELCDFSLKQNVSKGFPNDDCVPYCRLFSHNLFLSNLQACDVLSKERDYLHRKQSLHDCFL